MIHLNFPTLPCKSVVFSYVHFYCLLFSSYRDSSTQFSTVFGRYKMNQKNTRMLKSSPEELSYNLDVYLSPRQTFRSTTSPSSEIMLLSALQNSSFPSPSTYFSKPSRIINSLLPKGRLNIDRDRLTVSANGLIPLVSPWRDAQYLSPKFSSANFRSDFSSI